MDNLSSFYHKIQLPIIYIMLTNTYLKRKELFNANSLYNIHHYHYFIIKS